MKNRDRIVNALKKENIRHWQLSKILGVSESVLSRNLRDDKYSDEETEQILKIIEKGGTDDE